MLLLSFREQANTVPYLACCRREFCEFRPLVLVHYHASVFFHYPRLGCQICPHSARVANSNSLL